MTFKNINQRSWWEKTVLAKPYDLIIVGSGITGLSTALFYKERNPDHRVLILDRGFWPTGATGRNAGFACFGSAGELVDDLHNETKDEVYDRLRRRFEGLALLKSVLGEENIGFNMTGGYEIFDDEHHFRESCDNLPLFNEWVETVSGVANSYKITRYNGYDAIFNPLEGYINSGMLMQTLLKKVQDTGVEVRWNSPVQMVDTGKVVLDDGLVLSCEKVLLATNGFTNSLIEESDIKPARGYVFVTKPMKEVKWKGTCHYNRGYLYFRDLEDNRMLIGGARHVDKAGEESSLNEINPKIKNWLIDFSNEFLKLEQGWEIDLEWTGVMGFGKTKTPVCEQIKPGIYCSAGLAGMGIAIGMELGKTMAKKLGE